MMPFNIYKKAFYLRLQQLWINFFKKISLREFFETWINFQKKVTRRKGKVHKWVRKFGWKIWKHQKIF